MPSAPNFTVHDAGLHSGVLRALNLAGRALRGVGLTKPSLSPEAIIEAACKKTGLHDFDGVSWREGLDVVVDSFEREANLSTFGRIAVRGLLTGVLETRLRVIDWAKQHPQVRDEKIERPWVILGLPRTGTTLLSFLLGLDPTSRPLLQWEAGTPVPPPELATAAEDPRIAAAASSMGSIVKLNPPLAAMHPFGATLATECVTMLVWDMRSLSLETQGHIPSYGLWLEQADMHSAYEMHRLGLQILQSRYPTQTWSLKTPNHLWCLDTLEEFYPDARLIWTHRDPRDVVPSVASLTSSMYKTFSDRVDLAAVGRDWSHKLRFAIEKGMAWDDQQKQRAWCHHLLYADLMADPIVAVRKLYAHFGEEVGPLHQRRMEAWMHDRHQAVHGRHVYRLADFDLDGDAIDEQYQDYRNRYGIPSERR